MEYASLGRRLEMEDVSLGLRFPKGSATEPIRESILPIMAEKSDVSDSGDSGMPMSTVNERWAIGALARLPLAPDALRALEFSRDIRRNMPCVAE